MQKYILPDKSLTSTTEILKTICYEQFSLWNTSFYSFLHKIPTNVKYIRAILLLIMYCLCIYVYVYMCVHSTRNLLFRINIHCGKQIWSLSDESRCFCISCNNVLILSKYNVHGFFAGLPRNNETRVKTGNDKNGLQI